MENKSERHPSKEKSSEKLEAEKNQNPGIRRSSTRGAFFDCGSFESLRPNFDCKRNKLYDLMKEYQGRDEKSLMTSIVNHLEFTLATTRFNISNKSCYQAAALSLRDRLIEVWNDTQVEISHNNPKRIYYLSIEYLMGRSFQNAMINLNIEPSMKNALYELGIKIEELYDHEYDAGLGNGGLGRLAACYLDSMATMNYPAWGYGIRYNYGIFKQTIVNGEQKEIPDFWLSNGNPWEIERTDISYRVRFYGRIRKEKIDGCVKTIWEGGETVIAKAYDNPIPGFETMNTINLRLWRSMPDEEFNFERFNSGDYHSTVQLKQEAETITSVLYPNDSTRNGKELRLKQQYFFVAATIQDILRRFKKKNKDLKDLDSKVAIQLNDTHPSLSILELLRILIDEEGYETLIAWNIVQKVCSYTNHTVLPEALETWDVEIFGNLLPRHLELLYEINFVWMQKVAELFPGDYSRMARMSLIEESTPKKVRMANLSIIGSHKVNGVAKVHSDILVKDLFRDFAELDPAKFTNVTNGVTIRRWIGVANPELARFYEHQLGSRQFFIDYEMISSLLENVEQPGFIDSWKSIKLNCKRRLADWVKKIYKFAICETFMFDIMVKRFHEYKRQLLYCLYILHRYLKLKKLSNSEKNAEVKRAFFIGGKAAPGYYIAKQVIRFSHAIADLINSDVEISNYMKFIFLPNYCVSLAELAIPAADLSEHISVAGTEASGTSNMKFAMNGGLIIGTMDGANIEIAEEIGEENMFVFGKKVDEINAAREQVGL